MKLILGLKTIRGFDDSSINSVVLFKLGQYFNKKAKSMDNTLLRTILEERCAALYTMACTIASKLVPLHQSIESEAQLFSDECDEQQTNVLTEEAMNFLISNHFKEKSSGDIFKSCYVESKPAGIPFALFSTAESYRQLNSLTISDHTSNLEQAKFHLKEAITLLSGSSVFPFDVKQFFQTNQPPMAHILNDGRVVDSTGNIHSADFYINRVTPMKSAGEYLMSFVPETPIHMTSDYTPQSPDSSSENKKCQSPTNFTPCQSPNLKQLLYKPQRMEADSSSEQTNIPNEENDFEMSEMSEMSSQKQETSDAVMPIISRRVATPTDEGKVLCTIEGCQSRVKHLRNLKRHIQNFHGFLQKNGPNVGEFGIIRWVCKLCNKSNVSEFNYKRHYQTSHSDKRDEIVQNCIKNFKKMPVATYKQ